MKNLSAIPHGTPVFIDTNILVLAGGEGRLAQQCRDFLNQVRQRQVTAFTTTLVAAEVTHRVMVKEARERLGCRQRRLSNTCSGTPRWCVR